MEKLVDCILREGAVTNIQSPDELNLIYRARSELLYHTFNLILSCAYEGGRNGGLGKMRIWNDGLQTG